MKVTVFGIGYVGLVQAAVLAEVGHNVYCVDVNQQRITDLTNGIMPIHEAGLEQLVISNYQAGRMHFTTDAKAGVEHGEVQYIAVGTPPEEDGSADLQYVLAVADTIGRYMDAAKIIIDKSTVPVGTADKVKARIAEVLAKRELALPFDVVSNPEFLKEGVAVADCMRPDRIIVGTYCDRPKDVLRELYEPFNRIQDKMMFMDVRSAELTKYAANCMLATKISFMNEMANVAELVGADIEAVRRGIGSDPRIGYHFIYPGCGYGGSCFPKDVTALIRAADKAGHDVSLLKAVAKVNDTQKTRLFRLVTSYFGDNLQGKVFALWGLSFKPKTNDIREAPSRVLMDLLWQAGAEIKAYDPQAMEDIQQLYGVRDDLTLVGTKEAALKGADALLICTDWQQFKAPDFDLIKTQLNSPVIFDGRNLYEPERMKRKGFKYFAIGRGENVRDFT
ncbi:UDP-glucose dehydrogenase family protein [Arsukibacterium sp. UBA3155]|uniref:UDP-glucose dehydrogenase family protein n=1 Tax=Arsukibacterium sp. UBA3155 TaxID=1946058 RepID=UPI0025BD4FA4|nr:UDP-glucose/GDP-mannose dehydrogenase family protein [Arsukibacterium sp. UBA3155]|tara:strand:- start:109720 stop:111063 length:1344 start_codon:yes stop_codon:yes gene_type:complete